MTPIFAAKLGFFNQKTDIGAQKIDDSPLVTYGILLADFSIQNKLGKVWFFEKTFLLADTSIEVVLKMSFFTFWNANMQFVEKKLKWKSYIIAEVLTTIKKVELINKREFAAIALDENVEMFVLHVAILFAVSVMQVYSSGQA